MFEQEYLRWVEEHVNAWQEEERGKEVRKQEQIMSLEIRQKPRESWKRAIREDVDVTGNGSVNMLWKFTMSTVQIDIDDKTNDFNL